MSLSDTKPNLGSAKSGTHHWWLVKVTSVALIPLTLWFVWALMTAIIPNGADYAFILKWIKKPYNALPLVLLLGVTFYHAELGGQEVILDYVHDRRFQIPYLIAYKFFCYGMGILSVFAVLYITFRM